MLAVPHCQCFLWHSLACVHAEKQLAKYAEWHAPRAGMFLWLKLKHVEDSMDIFEELKEAKVVVVPGKASDTVLLLLWLTSA